MVAENNFVRVDTRELKDLIYRKIGHQRADEYFSQLRRFWGFKLNKADFDKSCIRTIGRENLPLHNQLIRSIIHNACQAKTLPQKAQKVEGQHVKAANGYQKNSLQSLYSDSFPQSPRKCRSPVSRDRKFRDRPSPLGPLGKSPSITFEETVSRAHEQQSATELHSLCSRPPTVEDGEEVEQFSSIPRWASVTAPLDVVTNTCSAHKTSPRGGFNKRSFSDTCQISGELPDTKSLMICLQKKLDSDGVGITTDCVNLLNNSLDVYLKRIIEPCISIAGSRCTDSRVPVGQSNNHQMVSGLNNRMVPSRFAQRQRQQKYGNMLDFHVAMESNPCILGEDWPIQIEKICHNMS